MEKIHSNVHVFVLSCELEHKACFHVKFPFSAYFHPLLHHNGKGSIQEEGICLTAAEHSGVSGHLTGPHQD